MGASARQEIELDRGPVRLRGTLWLPEADEPVPGVLMLVGSGDNDRDNNGLFPPLREHLVHSGVAVASYDKRGVSGSTGSWRTSTWQDLIDDAEAALGWLARHPSTDPSSIGVFGHSEGGWLALRVAADNPDVAYVVTNSGPAVSPARQIRHSIPAMMRSAGRARSEIVACLAAYDDALGALRRGETYPQAVAGLRRTTREDLDQFAGVCADSWDFLATKADHDPVADLVRLRCPQLAVFGDADPLVDVDESIGVLRAVAGRRPHAASLQVAAFPGADHRLGIDGELADGYLDTVVAFAGRSR
jgi:uncharacterized protein